MQELITVVVPVYNVEKYLSKCIESIVNQTYKNLEIILVDDGSVDSSGDICDKYAKRDKRIRVIHKENGGLSDARNKGISLANGKYIGFVDSDDIISLNMFEYLYKGIKEFNSQIAICNYICFDKKLPVFDIKYSSREMSGYDVLKEIMIDKKITNHTVDKLYLCSLFDDIKFPVGRKYEDIFTTYKLLLSVSKVTYVNCDLYGYYQRDGSITGSYNVDTVKDFIDAINCRYKELSDYNDDFNKYLRMNKVNSVLQCFLDIVKFKNINVLTKEKKFRVILFDELDNAKKIYTEDVRKINTRKKNVLIAILFFNPYIFYYIMFIYFELRKLLEK